MSIENNHFQSEILVSATADEIGYNGEWYKIDKKFLSLNFSVSYKHLLPNIGWIWKPLTMEWIPYFPQNGILFGLKGKWFFSHRKFAFVGMKVSGSFLWLTDKDVYGYINANGNSSTQFHLYEIQSRRMGFDLTAGRKFVNKFISEISLEAGFRFDKAKWRYECTSGCLTSGNDPMEIRTETLSMLHFQMILGFDIF
jgi:hypothetical protein